VGAGAGYEFHRARIGDHKGGDGFFEPTKSAVAAWLRNQGSGADTTWLRTDLEQAIRAAGRDPAKHDDDYIDFRVGSDLDSLIEAIRELQVESERAAERVEPTYPAPLGSVAEARAVLADAMDRFARAALAWPEEAVQLAAATEIERQIAAVESCVATAAAVLRTLDSQLSGLGYLSSQPADLFAGDGLDRLVQAAADVTGRVNHAMRIREGLIGHEAGHA
jgi:hypothetical protein